MYVPIRYTSNVWPARLAPSAPCSVMVVPAVVLAAAASVAGAASAAAGSMAAGPAAQGDAQRDRDEPVPAVRAGADADDVPHIVSFSYGRGRMPRPPPPRQGGE